MIKSEGAECDNNDVNDGVKLNNPEARPPPSKKLDSVEISQQLIDIITTYIKENTTYFCGSQIRAPNGDHEAEYYEHIKQPTGLQRVQQKLETNAYKDTDDLSSDIEQLVNNVKSLYKPDSVEHKKAVELWNLYMQSTQENGDNSNPYNPSMTATATHELQQTTATPTTGNKKKKKKQKIVTGYILYSSEVRKAVIACNPECTFGEISRIVGNEWRSLPTSTKQSWNERAARCNEEKLAEEMRELNERIQHEIPMDVTYECQWDTCDYQFNDFTDCVSHCIGVNTGHVQTHMQHRGSTNEFPCLWRNCERVRKGQAPFPNLPRLLRHVRDLHVNKGNGKMMAVHERSSNFVMSTKGARNINSINDRDGATSPTGSLSAMSPLLRASASPRCTGATVAGEFVTTPPKAQRVTRSEAYIRKFRQKDMSPSPDEPRQKTARTRDSSPKRNSNNRDESSPYKHEIITADVIPLFDPGSNDQCISQWINEIEQLGVIYNWTDNVKSDFMQSRLHGMAEVWHSTLQNHDMTWTEWKTKLLETFPKHIDFVKSLREMLARTKTPNENMTQYFNSKCVMLTKLEIFGDKAVECLIDGLPTTMQTAAREGHYHSPIELHSNFLSIVEDIKPELTLSEYDEIEVNDENKYVLCVVCPEVGHTASECPRNMYNDELVCWSKPKSSSAVPLLPSNTCVQEPVDSLIKVTIKNEQ